MKILFLLALLSGSFSLLTFARHSSKQKLGIQFLGFFFLTCYCLILATSLPLVWMDHWSLAAHTLMIFAVTAIPLAVLIHRLFRKNLTFEIGAWSNKFFILLAVIVASVWVQRHGVYNIYATHDPAAYIGSALNLSRTGSFFHHNEMAELAASGKAPHLESLLNRNNPPLVPDKMGTIALPNDPTKAAYHGVFGASLFYALGIEYFGPADFLRAHWLHLVVSLVLLFAILEAVTGPNTLWPSLGVILFASCPLVPGVFREALSEPLALVLFLGILLSLLKFTEEETAKYVLAASVLLSICVRVSGVIYVPPFLIAAVVLNSKTDRRYAAFTALGLAAVLFTISMTGAYYVRSIMLEHLKMLVPSVQPEAFPLQYVGLSLSLCGAVAVLSIFAMRKPLRSLFELAHFPVIWKTIWMGYFLLFAAGLAFRYGKLLTKLTQYYGGFPFLSYHLESTIFYFGPVVAIVGTFYWLRRCYQSPLGALTFLQLFFPFALFFYMVVRFLPLDVQMNFLRYLVIELLPLSIVGTIAVLAQLSYQKWRTALYAGSVAWGLSIMLLTNHSDICSGSFPYYAELVERLKTVEKPAVVVLKPKWRELTLLMPLHYAFGVPVLIANHGFSYDESAALDELKSAGYEPIVVVGNDQLALRGLPTESNHTWQVWAEIDHCYRYSEFHLMAPPLELQNNCLSMALLRPLATDNRVKDIVDSAWAYRHEKEPRLSHWYGATIDGTKACEANERTIDFGLAFDPESTFAPPVLKINGKTFAGVEVIDSKTGRKKTSHDVLVHVPVAQLNCSGSNTVDIFALPYAGSDSTRPVRLVPSENLRAKPGRLATAL